MTTKYNSNYEGTRPFSDTCHQVFVSTGVNIGVGIVGDPSVNFQAEFSYISTSNIFVGLNVFPVIPTIGAPHSETSYIDFRPSKRVVKGGDVLNFRTSDAGAYVGVTVSQL
jgi:hypothetical protein